MDASEPVRQSAASIFHHHGLEFADVIHPLRCEIQPPSPRINRRTAREHSSRNRAGCTCREGGRCGWLFCLRGFGVV